MNGDEVISATVKCTMDFMQRYLGKKVTAGMLEALHEELSEYLINADVEDEDD